MSQKKEDFKNRREMREMICPVCMGFPLDENGQICQDCGGKGVWFELGNTVFYFSEKNLLSVSLNFITKILSWTAGFLAVFGTIILGIVITPGHDQGIFALYTERGGLPLLFWLSLFISLFFIDSFLRRHESLKKISPLNSDLKVLFDPSYEKEKEVDISTLFNSESLEILRDAYQYTLSSNVSLAPIHVLKFLTQNSKIQSLFTRFEIEKNELEKIVNPEEVKINNKSLDGSFSGSLKRVLLFSFFDAITSEEEEVDIFGLFFGIAQDEKIKKMFYDLEIETEDIKNLIRWMRSEVLTKRHPRKVKHVVMNRAWTAQPTPFLDRFSYDLTDLARAGLIEVVVGRDREVAEAERILSRASKNNVLLVGEEGAGKMAVVRELTKRIVKQNTFSKLLDKRLVVLDAASLVADVRREGELEGRLTKVLDEVVRAGNIILCIPDIHNLAEVGKFGAFSGSEILAPVFSKAAFQVIGTTTPFDFHRSIEGQAAFASTFEKVQVNEMSPDTALEFLALRAPVIEQKNRVILTYGAMKKAVDLSFRFISDRLLPGKALDLLAEAGVLARTKGRKLVRDEDIREVITQKTGIPLTKVSDTESEKLLNLEAELHKRVINQEDAIGAISRSIRRVRVGLKEEKRPIGVFLFLGPTGVGKTETAKALAKTYFGSEETMIRLDMSEFQTKESIYSLIGLSGDNVSGKLTEQVKRKPFSLILLDELEKAHREVLNLFLQVFDDGRLTDNLGRVIDFSNTIIICTSNAGSRFIQEKIAEGAVIDSIKPQIEALLLEYFNPEFLNRFDDKIIFKPLSIDDVRAIAGLKITQFAKNLEKEQGMLLNVSDDAIKKLSELGYDPSYGARPLERMIQEKLGDFVATEILKKKYKRGDTVKFEVKDIK